MWTDYAGGAHYDEASRREKENFVVAALSQIRPASLWDLGANRGDFAIRHASVGEYAVALEADLGCAEACYAAARSARAPVATIWGDLLAPSPASGWANEERASLLERGPADMALALAIVHHLSITGGVPLERVASWLSQIARHAVVEVPSRDDPMVARLSERRHHNGAAFGPAEFRRAAQAHFEVLKETTLSGLPRTLFLLRRKSP